VSCSRCVCEFCTDLRTNGDFYRIQHQLVVFITKTRVFAALCGLRPYIKRNTFRLCRVKIVVHLGRKRTWEFADKNEMYVTVLVGILSYRIL
jgi:hypothetical protein